MSYYTSGIHCKQINPTSNSNNFRSEFKLPVSEGEIYLTDIRLCNVGRTTNTAVTINCLTGNTGMIKNIFLYDGNVVLDSILNFDVYAGFRGGYNHTNNDSIDKNKFLWKNRMGSLATGPRDASQTSSTIVPANDRSRTTTSLDTTPKSWISLKEWLAFLDESMYLPTKVFTGLRVVVEYSSSLSDMFPDTQSATSNTTTPFLQVNQLVNPKAEEMANKSYKGVVFRPLEHTVVHVPAITPTVGNPNVEQDITYTLNSYNNKTLQRLLMIKQPLRPNPSSLYGRLCSERQFKERNQVIVNGANLLPQNGLTTENMAKAMLYDLWSDCVDIAGSGWLPDADNMVTESTATLGKLDYRSVMVENFIQHIQVSFGRTGQFNVNGGDQTQYQSNGALRLHMFGEVNKALMVNPDMTYSIRYV